MKTGILSIAFGAILLVAPVVAQANTCSRTRTGMAYTLPRTG